MSAAEKQQGVKGKAKKKKRWNQWMDKQGSKRHNTHPSINNNNGRILKEKKINDLHRLNDRLMTATNEEIDG